MDRRNLIVFVVGGLLLAAGLAILVAPRASTAPDGLERVAADQGFADAARAHDLADGPLADYSVDGVEDGSLSTAMAGIVGIAITFGIGLLLFGSLRLIRARRHPVSGSSTS